MSQLSSFTERYAPAHGTRLEINGFTLERYRPEQHFELLNEWLAAPYASFWGMNGLSRDDRFKELADTDAKFGMVGQDERGGIFYTELYDPLFDEIGQHYSPRPDDCGMHLLLGPVTTPRHGFSRQVMIAVMTLILERLALARVVVEPDSRNDKIHRLNHAVGIRYQGERTLAHKTACLGFATRQDFLSALNEEVTS
ncbi:GNAT family N-acetyltransferase [Carnimonas bestiolae]|uniref:GNAT family N-acetyltransferase n=1 Tax=Carnimonas bestiolae TaxID=3402172 RepID=UPI003EDB876E